MKHLSLLIAAFALVLTQCERHSWEDVTDEHGHVTEKGTKRLFEEHGGDSHDADGAGHAPDPTGHGTEAAGHDGKGEEAETPETAPGPDAPADH